MGKNNAVLWTFVLIGFFALFTSCGELPTNYLNEPSNLTNVVFVEGKVQLPQGNSGNIYQNLIVSGATETSLAPDGSFKVKLFKDFPLSVIFLNTKEGKTVAAVYVWDKERPIVINDTTTAIFLTITTLHILGVRPDVNIIPTLLTRSDFSELVYYINSVMRNDFFNVLDYDVHPLIIEKAVEVAISYYNNFASNSNGIFGETEEHNSAYIICNNNEVYIRNPKAIPYGISYYNMDMPANKTDSYFLFINYDFFKPFQGRPMWVPESGIFNIIFGAEEVKFNLDDGNYLFCLSKMFFQDKEYFELLDFYLKSSDYLNVTAVDAAYKANIATSITILDFVLGPFFSAISLTKTILEGAINSDDIFDVLIDFFVEFLNENKENILKGAVKLFTKNSDKARELLFRLYRIIYKNLSDDSIESLVKQTENFVKQIEQIFNIIESFRFAYDLNTADNRVYYKIYKNGDILQCVESIPPSPPIVQVIPSSNFFPTGNTITFRVYSIDPQQKPVKYYFLKNNWQNYDETGYLPSGTMHDFTFTPTQEKTYYFRFYALNEDGAMSAPTRITIKAVPSSSIFSEDFTTYSLGLFNSNTLWNVEYKSPSAVRIVQDRAVTPQSAKFIDYDPAIGYEYGYYAHMYSYIAGQPQQISFYMKVDDAMDNFGVRAWPTLDGTTVPSFYVVMANGWLRYVNEGIDPNNALDFVPVTQVKADTWYKITLNLNWTNQEYDLYVNDTLVKQGIKFISYNWGMPINSAPYFQVIAFIDTQCRGGYIDDIMITGSTFNGLQKVGVLDIAPQILKQKISLK